MRRSLIIVFAVVGLIGWQWQRVGVSKGIRPVRSAYDTAVNRQHGAESLRRAISPQQALPLADADAGTSFSAARGARADSARRT